MVIGNSNNTCGKGIYKKVSTNLNESMVEAS
jgi:hypothetical protein